MGKAHALLGRNRQDAFVIARSEEALVAVVSDGCGSAPHSEIGAFVGTRVCADALLRGVPPSELLQEVRTALDRRLFDLGDDLGLFTLVVAIVTAETTTVLALGDGVVRFNETVIALGPFPDDAPPYVAYPDAVFRTVVMMPTAEVSLLAIGTDGATDVMRELSPALFANEDGLRRKIACSKPHDDATVVMVAP